MITSIESRDGGIRITLRPATEADVPFLLDLRRDTMSAHQLASGVTPSEEERIGRVRNHFDCAQIVLHEGQPAGLFKASRTGMRWQLIQIQLVASLQGHGLGAALIGNLIAEARAAHATLFLTVLKANPARRLYERLGFRVVGEDRNPAFLEMQLD